MIIDLITHSQQELSSIRVSSPDELTVSVVVPVYNGGEKFGKCLASLKAAVPPPHEIIVVADGDTDGSWQLADEFGVRVFRFPSPGGPARARNFGASQVCGVILFFVDADVTIPPDAIGRVVTVFKREPDLTALFGSYDDEPGEPNFLSQYRNLLHHYVHQSGCEEASTFWGACGAIRRDVFLAIGGFDGRYHEPSIEDIELGYRLRKAGHNIRLCKFLQVKHWKRWEVVSMLKADFFQRALPWAELILSDRNFINDLNVGMSGRLSVVLMFGLLSALALAPWQPLALAAGGLMALLLLTLNAPLYRFFVRKRGLRFALQAIPWHWFYFFYSGLAFVVATVRHFVTRGGHPGVPASPTTCERANSEPRSESRR